MSMEDRLLLNSFLESLIIIAFSTYAIPKLIREIKKQIKEISSDRD